MVGGLSAAALHGLQRWPREEITILVANPMSYDPLPGFRFFRTRRPFGLLVAAGELPVARVEPAVLMFASEEPHLRTALGAVTASVQQRLTTVGELREWVGQLAPLRRARHVRALLDDVAGGAHSLAEVDLRKACRDHGVQPPRSQRARFDRGGRKRYTDGEWTLPNGTVVVLEVDGAFHDDAHQGTLDRRRNRRLTSTTRIVVQCSAWEIRLRAVGGDVGPDRARRTPHPELSAGLRAATTTGSALDSLVGDAVETVAGVTEAGHDVALLVQPLVEGRGHHGDRHVESLEVRPRGWPAPPARRAGRWR